jgi:hypothetical protein
VSDERDDQPGELLQPVSDRRDDEVDHLRDPDDERGDDPDEGYGQLAP